MTKTKPTPFIWHGKQATMTVMRNDGECWGRLECDGESFDVPHRDDVYDWSDSAATLHFIARALKYPTTVEPAVGWF